MSEQSAVPTGGAMTSRPTGATNVGTATVVSALSSSKGTTTINDVVVSKIAGIATHEVDGVHAMGSGTARAMGSLRERIPGSTTNQSRGVTVEVGETQAAIDLSIVAEYGVAIADLAEGIRRNVIASVERMTGLEVTEVNINVTDVHLPEDDVEPEREQRVQ
ncbi:Asp23/Gls24 family envelope stress response protein [Georgenia sp. SYP-B2076]|uniref:Asp23/Gls24 family envelope stress response protein n=1 Tax=Georgenia sp. SYP-B2076 TaxID=2495881 RepID=UPI001F0CDD38|nr:Asp23/Gls24 family envelope stress response protein [Georgenia sp. SYP-B2076]